MERTPIQRITAWSFHECVDIKTVVLNQQQAVKYFVKKEMDVVVARLSFG